MNFFAVIRKNKFKKTMIVFLEIGCGVKCM